MAKYLDENGLARFWDNIKTYVNKKPQILCFGDSYGANYDADGRGLWTKQLNETLSDRYEIINHCVGNSTFSRLNGDSLPIIYDQVTASLSDPIVDADMVKMVVMVGGRNDSGRSTVANAVSGLRNTIDYIYASYPNARIIVGVGNWYSGACTASAMFIRMQYEAQRMPNCVCTRGMWNVLLGKDSYTPEATNTHPIPSGMRLITNMLLGAMFGGNVGHYEGITISGVGNGAYVVIDNETISISFTKSSITAGEVINAAAILPYLYPIQTYFTYANSSGNSGIGRVKADGTIELLTAGSNMCINIVQKGYI